MDGDDLKRVLRELFEAQVMNYGDYNLVYGQPSGPSSAYVLGYRYTPLELVICPVEMRLAPRARGSRPGSAAQLSGVLYSVTLADVATVADTGTGYQVQSVTGFRAWFEVTAAPQVPVGAATDASGDGTVVLHQDEDAEEFHQFMGHFMDTLEAYYAPSDGRDPPS